MFSIHSIAPPTPSVGFRTAVGAGTQALQAGADWLDTAPLRDELHQVLREGGAIGEHLLPAVLQLIPTLDEWPRGVQIAFHSGDGESLVRYGTALDPHEPVHVVQWPDGRYAAAHRGDDGLGHWVDCGPDPDALFDAVLEGLEQRDAVQHARFTQALMEGCRSPCTDAQKLRDRLAEQLERSHPASMHALQALDPPTHSQQGKKPVDAALLLKISAMSPQEIHRRGGLVQVANDEHVDYLTLRKGICVTGGLTPLGHQRVRMAMAPGLPLHRITAPLLRDILLREREKPQPRSAGELALHYHVSVRELSTLVDNDLNLKPSGVDLLEGRPSVLPLTPDVLRTIAGQVESGRITDYGDLRTAARQFQVSFQQLRRFVNPGHGLTGTGKRFLARSWTQARIARVLNAVHRLAPQASTQGASPASATDGPRYRPVTADLLLEIRRNGPAWIKSHGGLRHFAESHQVSFATLKKCVVASTATLTSEGMGKVRKAYPDIAIDGPVDLSPATHSRQDAT